MLVKYRLIFAALLWCFLLLPSRTPLQAQPGERPQVPPNPVSEAAREMATTFYEYDRQVPMDGEVVGLDSTEIYTRYKIAFRGVRDSRVPGYLAIPRQGEGPFPLVLVMHGLSGSKDNWWRSDEGYASELLKAGMAVLTLDAQYHGERIVHNDYENPAIMVFQRQEYFRFREVLVQTVTEYRRALDYLKEWPQIDGERIGASGYSMGGMMTFLLTAVDERIDGSVACVPPLLANPTLAGASPYHFAPGIDQPFLMLVGRRDRFYSEAEGNALFEQIGAEEKDIIWYDSGHGLPEAWIAEAVDWLKTHVRAASR